MYAKDIASSLFMLGIAVAFWLGADRIPVSPLEGQVGAAGFPKLLAVSLGILSVIRLGQTALLARRNGWDASSIGAGERLLAAWREHRSALGMLGLGIGYVLLLPILGYALSIALLIASVAIYSGRRPGLELAAVAIGGTAALYIIFVWLLGVRMPEGIWTSRVFG